jgi:hypothetical protein
MQCSASQLLPVCVGPLIYCLLTSSAVDAELTKNPVDGFSAGLVDDSNIFEWAVTIIGPPDTL